MNGLIRALTVFFFALPCLFLAEGLRHGSPLLGVGGLLLLLDVEVYLVHRPRRFTLEPGALVLEYPVRAKRIPLRGLTAAEGMGAEELRARFGRALRVGVGGLFGGFGWLYTSKGWVELDISRTDGLVLLTFEGRIPLLVSPEAPAGFIAAVQDAARR
ncbi:MAG: hypothetical protein AMXMBFR34_52850 [Myxococcaceae bacterium]